MTDVRSNLNTYAKFLKCLDVLSKLVVAVTGFITCVSFLYMTSLMAEMVPDIFSLPYNPTEQ